MRQNRIRFETFDLDLRTGELRQLDRRIPLQDKPARLLTLLAGQPGTLVTRDEIQRALWADGEFVEFEHAVNVAISKIRAALGDNADSPRIIQTLPKKGYRFIANVEPEVIPAKEPAPAAPSEFVLPITRNNARVLYLLAQLPYVAGYLATFYYWNSLDDALLRTFPFAPVEWSALVLQVMSMVGFAVRIYLLTLVGWGHTDMGPRLRKLFPFLLPLDVLWAITPLLVDVGGPLLSAPGMILMVWLVFGQRTLMKAIDKTT